MLIPIGPISTTCEARGPGVLSPSTSGAARAFPKLSVAPACASRGTLAAYRVRGVGGAMSTVCNSSRHVSAKEESWKARRNTEARSSSCAHGFVLEIVSAAGMAI